MNREYDLRMATQAEILLRRIPDMISVIQKTQIYLSDMNSSLAFKLWQQAEMDLCVFQTCANKIKEEYGTPEKES